MELQEVIRARRSVRRYHPEPPDRATIERLLETAVRAPSAMNSQPWAFGVLTDRARMFDYSTRAKALLRENLVRMPWLERFRDRLDDTAWNIFHDAPALVIIYARPTGPHPQGDCAMAALALMLAARDAGLGSCWIGLAAPLLDTPEVKAELGVPAEYRVVAPLVLGRPADDPAPSERRPPELVFWR